MNNIKGSKIARDGFENEKDVANKFNNWRFDIEAQEWLNIMGYSLKEIEYVKAVIIHGQKTDVQVQVTIKVKQIIEAQNLQVKLVSNKNGFNQIDKRWVDKYAELWNMPQDVVKLLKYFTGELSPYKTNIKDSRRMYINEFNPEEQKKILSFFNKNKSLIIMDLIKGRGILAAEWILVVQKIEETTRWTIKPINVSINHYSNGDINITKEGNLKIGKISMQRKGGDNGRETANMLQFKLNPIDLFNI